MDESVRGDEFWHYARNMWLDNCKEREEYGEKPYEFETYIKKYDKWLMVNYQTTFETEKKGWFKWL